MSVGTPPGQQESAVLAILQHRTGEWATAGEVRRELGLDAWARQEVNRCLYQLRASGRVQYLEGSPPSWRVLPAPGVPSQPAPPSAPAERSRLHCIIDLGNCHDCLKNLLDYARGGSLTVAAYADLAFAGFGVVPPLDVPNVRVFRATTPDKNSADVQIIWDVSRLVLEAPPAGAPAGLHIIVATKDLGFQRLKALVDGESPDHALTFVTDWASLRLFVE